MTWNRSDTIMAFGKYCRTMFRYALFMSMHTTRTRSRPSSEQRKVCRDAGDIEGLVLAEVAERGGKAHTPREPMLVDTKKTWTEPVLKLSVLQQDHLMVETLGRSYGNTL